jgi:LPXTG-motif cell wall-anchored protein
MNHPAKLPHTGDSAGFLQALAGFSVAALVAFGVGGSLYKLITPGGWIGEVFGRSVAGGLAVLLALLMVGISIWLTRAWISTAQRRLYSELFVYVFAGLGLVYAVELLMKGGA